MHLDERERGILDRQINGLQSSDPADSETKGSLLAYATFSDKFIILISFICAILAGALNPLVPVIYGQLVGIINGFSAGTVSSSKLRSEIAKFALYYVYLSIGLFVFTYVSTVGFYYCGERVARSLRRSYLKAILRQNIAFFDLLSPGEITTRIMSDMGLIQEGITSKLSITLTAIATFVAALIISFVLSWRIALILSPTYVLMIVSGMAGGAYAVKHHHKARSVYSRASGIAEEAIASVRHVSAFGIQELLAGRYHSTLTEAAQSDIKARNAIAGMIAWSNTMPCLVYALSFWAGSIYLVKGETTVSSVSAITLTVAIGGFAIARIAPSAQGLTSSVASSGAVLRAIARRSPQDPFETSGEQPSTVRGDIELRGTSLVYPSRDDVLVLDDVNITCPAMKTTAIVGSSGSGKSSIIGLLERFYEPTKGQILLDGRDIQSLNLRWLRRQISLVDQEPVLFNTTIFENISYGQAGLLSELSEKDIHEQVIEAAKKANAHEFITSLPDAYDTRVGQKGLQLSGGQRQRIAIARALMSNPKILLLDEATSALDSKSEATVQRALDAAAQHRTTVVVAHRLSTIRNADKIIVMSNGRVVEEGIHSELIARDGIYAGLVEKQQIESSLQANATVAEADGVEGKGGLDIPHASANTDMEKQDQEASGVGEAAIAEAGTEPILAKQRVQKRLSLRLTLAFLTRMNREELKLLIFGLVCAIIAGLGIPGQSLLFAKILATLGRPSSQYVELRREVNLFAGLYLVTAGVAMIFWTALGVALSYATEKLSRRVRDRTFRSIMSQDISFFDEKEHSTGVLSSLLSASTEELTGLSGPVIGGVLTFISTILAGIILSLAIGWKLALVCAATIPVVVACGWVRLQMLAIFDSKIRQSGKDSASYASELVGSVRTVASLGLEESVLLRYDGFLAQQTEKSLRSILSASSLYAASQSLVFCCAALAFWYGGKLVAEHEYSLFQFYICFVALISGSQIAGSIFSYAPDASKAMQASRELEEVMERKPTVNIASHSTRPMPEKQSSDGGIELQNVSFRYPSRTERLALDNFSLKIEPGQTIALVGPSGCGKSTVISLIERFYDPECGTVKVDGIEISGLDVNQHRQRLSLVSQEATLYSGTIRDNIMIGQLPGQEVDDNAILNVCKQANIYDFIASLPEGLSTLVGTGGSMLSGGQKQRIAIARALMRSPKILLLDEATSALDTESEALVQQALDAAAKGRTTISVAHRLSTIKGADAICVLDRGRLMEMGTHDELMRKKGRYWELVKMQNL